MTANPHTRFSSKTPPHRDLCELFWQVSQRTADPPQSGRSALKSSRETELPLQIYWVKFLPALILAMDFWHFWLHPVPCQLSTVWPLQKQTHSFFHRVFFLSSYLSKTWRAACVGVVCTANFFFFGLMICIIFCAPTDHLHSFWNVQWRIAKLISSRKWLVIWNLKCEIWSRCGATHVLVQNSTFCHFSFSRTICFQISERCLAVQPGTGWLS